MYCKIKAAITKKKSLTRTLYVSVQTIADAMEIVKKIKGDLISIDTVSYDEYMKHINNKYTLCKS